MNTGKFPKRIAVRKVNQAISASCKAIASLAIRAFTSSSCVCFAFSAGIALTTKIVPPILYTKPVFISSTVITSLRKNRGVRFPLYSFGAILGVFFRYERLCFSGGILYRQPFKSRCLSLPGNKKRRIATTLLSCSEDGAREHYSIICCTFSFC